MRWQPQSSTDKRFLGMTLTMTMRLGLPGVDRGGYGVDTGWINGFDGGFPWNCSCLICLGGPLAGSNAAV
jgi:hypothetical protein